MRHPTLNVTKAQIDRILSLYKSGMPHLQIYASVFPHLPGITDQKKRNRIQLILQRRAGYIRDQDERGRFIHRGQTPKTYTTSSRWKMKG